jgi:putative transposase
MANTYTQIHIHFILVVKFRQAVISPLWKNDLYGYITGIIQKYDHKLLAINGMPDHVHIFVGMRPTQTMSDLMQDVKGSSSKWINNNSFIGNKFAWQSGFAAFSYCKSEVQTVINYINNQEKHHSKKKFMIEFKELLQEFNVEYDERYLFKEIDYSSGPSV